LLESLKSEKRLNDTSLHVKGAGAEGSPGSDAERHARECPGGIDGVVMAENEELARGAGRGGRPDNPQVIATLFLLEGLDKGPTLQPLIRKKSAATVRGRLFEARGFEKGEIAKRVEHIFETRPQERQEGLRKRGRGHRGQMVATG